MTRRNIEVCWSDEPGNWKPYHKFVAWRPVEQQLRELQDEWLATKEKYQLKHDLLVRVR